MGRDLSTLSDEELQALIAARRAAPKTLDPQPDPVAPATPEEPKAPPAPATFHTGMSLEDATAGARKNAGQFLDNVGTSGSQFVKDVVTPFVHPIETAKNVGRLGMGVAEKFTPGVGPHEKYADAAGEFYKNRYGSWDDFANTLYTDPIGAAADLSIPFTGGGSLAARAPGMLGKVGKVTSEVSRALDPVNAAVSLTKNVGKGVGFLGSELVGGLGTGTGGRTVRVSAKTGFNADVNPGKAEDFQRHMRDAPGSSREVVKDAVAAANEMKRQRGLQYKVDKMGWDESTAAGKTQLDFQPILDAVDNGDRIKKFKGEELLGPKGSAMRDLVRKEVEDWGMKDPANYHTAEGLDALKQKIGNIRDEAEFNSPERAIASDAYSAIWKQIESKHPKYADAMRNYEEASELIREIEGTLSLPKGKRGSIDTSLRKLQSILRNNANTNYGRRVELGDMLVKAGATNLIEKLTGQAMSSWMPRGLGQVTMGSNVLGQLGLGALAHTVSPAMLATIPMSMPRLVGEGAYYAGRGAKVASKVPLKPLARALYQSRGIRNVEEE